VSVLKAGSSVRRASKRINIWLVLVKYLAFSYGPDCTEPGTITAIIIARYVLVGHALNYKHAFNGEVIRQYLQSANSYSS